MFSLERILGVLCILTVFLSKGDPKPVPDQQGNNDDTDHDRQFWDSRNTHSVGTRGSDSSYGLGPEVYSRVAGKARRFRQLWAQRHKQSPPKEPILSSVLFDDIIFPEYMLDYLIEEMRNVQPQTRNRYKRKVRNFQTFSYSKWPDAPIPYVFNTTSGTATDLFRQAMRQWEEQTCIRFYELVTKDRQDYIVYENVGTGCFAHLGRYGQPQKVNVGSFCQAVLGYAVHEIGHALGLYHEHSRYDRDNYIQILHDNIDEGRDINFLLYNSEQIDTYNIPYDFSSVMHYTPTSFSRDKASKLTIMSRDPLYQKTMGQRFSLSFFDVKAANRAYCANRCVPSALQCERGGYPDPNDCSKCKCPEGFGGIECQSVASSFGTGCPSLRGLIVVTSRSATCVRAGPYSGDVSCNWLLKASPGSRIDFWFQGTFDVLCSSQSFGAVCSHYVQVTYKDRLQNGGPRFCCNRRPFLYHLTSEYNEIAVTFRTPGFVRSQPLHGFTMCFAISEKLSPGTTQGQLALPSVQTTSSPYPRPTTSYPTNNQQISSQTTTNIYTTTPYWWITTSTTPLNTKYFTTKTPYPWWWFWTTSSSQTSDRPRTTTYKTTTRQTYKTTTAWYRTTKYYRGHTTYKYPSTTPWWQWLYGSTLFNK